MTGAAVWKEEERGCPCARTGAVGVVVMPGVSP